MRIDKTYYELMQIEQKYMEKGSPLPTFIQQEYQITLLIDNAWRTLNRYSSGKKVAHGNNNFNSSNFVYHSISYVLLVPEFHLFCFYPLKDLHLL